MTKLSKLHSTIEAILFLENSFVSLQELAKKTNSTKDKVEKAIIELNEYYKNHKHSFIILGESSNYLLAIKQELALELSHFYKAKHQQKLSKAVIETLAVIAYSQPITKPEIDQLRGVNSDGALKILLTQNLIKVMGKRPIPGNPNEYGTSSNFLKTFGLKSIKDLPKMNEQEMKKFVSTQQDVPKDEDVAVEEIEEATDSVTEKNTVKPKPNPKKTKK